MTPAIGHNGGPPLELQICPSLNEPQTEFILLDRKFKAFVAGFGSGKTWVGCTGIIKHFLENPNVNAGYFAPSFPHIRDIFYPTIEEVAAEWGLKVKLKKSDKEVLIYDGRKLIGKVICRSMDDPSSIVGFKIGHALIDEIDILDFKKAQLAWRKIIARLRWKPKPGQYLRNGVDVTTTPEGFKFVYEQFVKQIRANPKLAQMYGLVQASTYDNELNLPEGYIESLFESYPVELIAAYLNGQFTNLTSGSVYPNFDRKKNHINAEIMKREVLHVGMDFNVMNMSAIVCVIRNGIPIAVEELTGIRDTPAMADALQERYGKQDGSEGHAIIVYPDASGANTSSKNASESDLSILRQRKFQVQANNRNPAIKDRVLSVNALILNGEGERRLRVNTHNCPKLTESLEKQAYDDNGMPDKKTGFDHTNDAFGYFINTKYPIVRNTLYRPKLHGV